MRNLRLDICYDGTRYKGWQRLADEDKKAAINPSEIDPIRYRSWLEQFGEGL